jgi:Family of unknown function (DUF6364)
MRRRLTLRLDEKLIEKAKKIAKNSNVSLSELVTDFLKSVTNSYGEIESSSPVLSEISGILPGRRTQKALHGEYGRHIEEKYRRN